MFKLLTGEAIFRVAKNPHRHSVSGPARPKSSPVGTEFNVDAHDSRTV